uniref:Uncharacterized protein n=1 Tax=Meloidogyne incognita TaxID=6306 RepID=A0A914KJP1_MELIC
MKNNLCSKFFNYEVIKEQRRQYFLSKQAKIGTCPFHAAKLRGPYNHCKTAFHCSNMSTSKSTVINCC